MAQDAWLAIVQAARSARGSWHRALRAAGSPQALIALSPRALAEHGLESDEIERLKSPDRSLLDRWRVWLDQPSRALVCFGEAEYPPLLALLPDAPLALWVQGARPEMLAAPQLAMVGSRNPTMDGRQNAEQFAKYLSERGMTITSGLAVGIDGASHRGALQGVGKTVAVLGGGLDAIFPRAHERLAGEIAAQSVLVSEYGPGIEPKPYHFPQRNRIIAGLAVGTLVVEATKRSGSLITAKCALDYGREVFAIPGSIHNPLARGCHSLIREGAKLVEEAGDILVELAPLLSLTDFAPSEPPQSVKNATPLDDPAYANVLEMLGFAPTTISELIERAGLTTAELSSMLLVLELEGFVEALPGGRYARLAPKG